MKVSTLGILSFAKLQTLILGFVGLLAGLLYSFGGLLIDALVTLDILSPEKISTPGLSVGTILAFGALVGMPVIFGGVGFVFGLIEATLFNLISTWFGYGIELDVR